LFSCSSLCRRRRRVLPFFFLSLHPQLVSRYRSESNEQNKREEAFLAAMKEHKTNKDSTKEKYSILIEILFFNFHLRSGAFRCLSSWRNMKHFGGEEIEFQFERRENLEKHL
jgi:hypothetical protein